MATFSGLGGTSMSRAQVSSGGRSANGGGAPMRSAAFDRYSSTPSEAVSTRETQMQLLKQARMMAAPSVGAPRGGTAAVAPSLTAESTALQLRDSRDSQPQPPQPQQHADLSPTPEEGQPPQESEFKRMYREGLEREQQAAVEKDRQKEDALGAKWEKLESERVGRDVKALRLLVEEMGGQLSEFRRQAGNERAARLSLEQQVHEQQHSLAALERTHERQATELRIERQRQETALPDAGRVSELTKRVVALDAALMEEQEERARMGGLLRDIGASKRDLSERVDELEQQLSRRKSDAEIERQVHNMQDECLSQVESMSRMLDEMASVATRVDASEEQISRSLHDEQQRRATWESEQQRHRIEFEKSMATLATNQHTVALATLQRRFDDDSAVAEAEEAEEQAALMVEQMQRSRMARTSSPVLASTRRSDLEEAAVGSPYASRRLSGGAQQGVRVTGQGVAQTNSTMAQSAPSPGRKYTRSPPQLDFQGISDRLLVFVGRPQDHLAAEARGRRQTLNTSVGGDMSSSYCSPSHTQSVGGDYSDEDNDGYAYNMASPYDGVNSSRQNQRSVSGTSMSGTYESSSLNLGVDLPQNLIAMAISDRCCVRITATPTTRQGASMTRRL